MSGERLTVATPRGEVSAVWEPADGPVIVVGHGAGAGMEHPFIVGFCEALAGEGLASLRFNFPYMEAGRRTPDQATNGVAAFRAAFDAATERGDGRPVLAGGKSYGGRIASMAAADRMPARALVFLGYPLHPPGKPERIRDEHLYGLEIPMLFLHGTKDPFADPALLTAVVERLGDRTTLVEFDGAGHSFERSRKDDAGAIGASLAPIVAGFVRERV